MSFMILSVGGIILIQWYFIYTSIDNREEEFSMAVKASLSSVSTNIQEDELLHYIETFESLTDTNDPNAAPQARLRSRPLEWVPAE